MVVRRVLMAIGVFAVLNVGLAGTALAGQETGTGDPTPAGDKARSLCAFSGLADELDTPGETQNWGQIIRIDGPSGGANDIQGFTGCNANDFPNPRR